jgi:hypothetical protein
MWPAKLYVHCHCHTITFLFINTSVRGWDVYTFNTTDCEGSEYHGSGYQVIYYRKLRLQEDSFLVFSIAVSMSVLAGSTGGLISASYSTFCKFVHTHRVYDLTE